MNDNSNLLVFPGETKADFDPVVMLETAKTAGLEKVAIVGWDSEGELFLSSSFGTYPDLLWLLKQAEKFLLDV